MDFKNALKNVITAGNNKYTLQQHKVGTIVEVNDADNYYTVSVINRDGIKQLFYKVPVIFNSSNGQVTWKPTQGEEVMVQENNKSYIITGPFDEIENTQLQYDIYAYTFGDDGGLIQ